MTRLRHTSAADVVLLWRLLQRRALVSSRLGIVEPGRLFVIDEIFVRTLIAGDLPVACIPSRTVRKSVEGMSLMTSESCKPSPVPREALVRQLKHLKS